MIRYAGVAILVLAPACAKEVKPASPPAPAVASAAPAPADPLAERLRHCPLTVDGTEVAVSDADSGVLFRVKAADGEMRAEVVRRAHHLEEFTRQKGRGTGVAHGKGQGGGWMRDCPIVTKDTLVEAVEVADGVDINVRATSDDDIERLRAESRRRLTALRARPH
jgi:hypothetical protein